MAVIDLDRMERACLEWRRQLIEPWTSDDETVRFNGNEVLGLIVRIRELEQIVLETIAGIEDEFGPRSCLDLKAILAKGATTP